MKLKHYILIGIISYLLFTLASTPASTVYSLISNDKKPPVSLQGISGSVWHGSAERIDIPSVPQLQNIHWTLNPFALLIARLSASVEADINNNKVSGKVSVNSSGEISGSDIKTRLASSTVQNLLKLPLGEISGNFLIDIDDFDNSQPLPMLKGEVIWQQAVFTLADSVNLGTVNLNIKPAAKNALEMQIINKGGDIDISGNMTISDNKNYNLDINFKPLESTKNNIKQSLAMFARKQANGVYSLKKTGNLKALGF